MSGWRLGSNQEDLCNSDVKGRTVPSNNDIRKPERKMTLFELSDPRYCFDDLILSERVFDEIQTVVHAKKCWDVVFQKWGLSKVMKDRQNLLVNLYGEPGTGKTVTAHAISHELKQRIICVNYADIESKYVGDTSKNLSALFRFAADQEAIIFFDEADALLSKRVTDMSSATDVSVNQTRSVLLTLLNDYKGMVIFASNFISNYDPAFMRRIQYHIKLELPTAELREKLWRKYIPLSMPNNVDFSLMAQKYDNVSGSDISNAVLKAALYAARKKSPLVQQKYFQQAIESIQAAKLANSPTVHTETREISEEYALNQLKK